MRTNRHFLGTLSQKRGDAGEDIAALQLSLSGFEMVEKIHTGWRIIRWLDRTKMIAHVVPFKKVSADYNAIYPRTGQRVLVEVKTNDKIRLTYTTLKEHQHLRLQENITYGGISLLIWVNWGTVHVMDYSKLTQQGFKKRSSINLAMTQDCSWTEPIS